MEKIKIFLVVYFAGLSTFCLGQKYDFPIKPGSMEWSKLSSTNEMIKVCQIPESTLMTISTHDLLTTCLDYPLLIQYTAANSLYDGIVSITTIFNWLNELINRRDISSVIIDYYENWEFKRLEDEIKMGEFAFKFLALELIISHEKILTNATNLERKRIIDLILLKYNEKLKYDEYFGFLGKMTTTFSLTKYVEILYNEAVVKNDEQALFSEKMLLANLQVVDDLYKEITDTLKANQ